MNCITQPPKEPRDDRFGGPTPRGEYLIGKRSCNDGTDWYKLYPKKEDNSGYYPYEEATKTGRDRMGLHPGTISEGCVTVKAPNGNEDPCWKKIREVIDCCNMRYRGKIISDYSGFLYVK